VSGESYARRPAAAAKQKGDRPRRDVDAPAGASGSPSHPFDANPFCALIASTSPSRLPSPSRSRSRTGLNNRTERVDLPPAMSRFDPYASNGGSVRPDPAAISALLCQLVLTCPACSAAARSSPSPQRPSPARQPTPGNRKATASRRAMRRRYSVCEFGAPVRLAATSLDLELALGGIEAALIKA
jgi:hypothetical protein